MKKIREVIDLKKCHGLENNTESENGYLSSVNHFNNQCKDCYGTNAHRP
jgi:hypothetical protein